VPVRPATGGNAGIRRIRRFSGLALERAPQDDVLEDVILIATGAKAKEPLK